MNLFAPPRSFDPDRPEWIDRTGLDRVLLRQELQLLAEVNERFGGNQLMLRYVKQFMAANRMESLNILDLATGSADVPRAIVTWARERKLPVTITAVDHNPDILEVAREHCRDWPEIQFAGHDLRTLPFAPDSFDLVLCSLALHHFTTADAVALLRRIGELARHGYVVNDLRRNWLAIRAADRFSRELGNSEIFTSDAVQSCRAAFTVGELRTMAQQAGLRRFRIRRHQWFFRMVLAGNK